jgi:hypothetical protein
MVEVLCLWSLLAGNAGIWRKQVSEFQSGYLTMIPVGAYLKLPQQDIDVNGSDGGRGAPWIAIPIAPRLEQSRRRSHLRSGPLLFFCEIPHAVPV